MSFIDAVHKILILIQNGFRFLVAVVKKFRKPLRLARNITFLIALVVIVALLYSSFHTKPNPISNVPMVQGEALDMGSPNDIMGANGIALSFSGGGLRAAAFSHGVLKALESMKTPQGDLLDDVTYISGVSGGSLPAAYYGLHGRRGLDHFEQDVLLQDYEAHMRLSVLLPTNMLRLIHGGLNDHANFRDELDEDVFKGATFADIYQRPKPDIRIHATDLYHGTTFPFIPPLFNMLCSDLRSYKVADAVAASMAVPLVFQPVVLQTYPNNCQYPLPTSVINFRANPDLPRLLKAEVMAGSDYRDPKRLRYLKLVDGSLSDNFGVSSLLIARSVLGTPYAPITQRDAVKVRRLLFIIVDADQGRNGDWAMHPEGPTGAEMALSSTDASITASARLSADAMAGMIQDWQNSIIGYRCSLSYDEVINLGGPTDWRCGDVKFSFAFISTDRLNDTYRHKVESIPTRLHLSETQVNDTIAGAEAETLALPNLQAYLHDRVASGNSH